MCTGTLENYEQTIGERGLGQGGARGGCVRVHRYTMSKQSGDGRVRPCIAVVKVRTYAELKKAGPGSAHRPP